MAPGCLFGKLKAGPPRPAQMAAPRIELPAELSVSEEPVMTPEDVLAGLADLHLEAVATSEAAVAHVEETAAEAEAAEGERLRAEVARLRAELLSALPGAVREAAAAGQRAAVLLRFQGADKLGDYCYLYMIKGPRDRDEKNRLRAWRVRPLLHDLGEALRQQGFKLHHAWQRSTNENTLTVMW
jgi:hypothetical protein